MTSILINFEVNAVMGIYVLVIYCFQFGVGIGMTWEGIIENDYNKVDQGYNIEFEAIYNLALTISSIWLGIFFDTNAFDYISGTASYYDVIDKYFNYE